MTLVGDLGTLLEIEDLDTQPMVEYLDQLPEIKVPGKARVEGETGPLVVIDQGQVPENLY